MSLAPLGHRARTKVSETPKKRRRDNRFTKNDSSQVWQHKLAIPDSKMQQDHKFKTILDNFAKTFQKSKKRAGECSSVVGACQICIRAYIQFLALLPTLKTKTTEASSVE